MRLTVVVCTFNRQDLILQCLLALADQTISPKQYEVLIIDNNSTDATSRICQEFVAINSNFRYIKEVNQGLSHARNRGYLEANTDWVAYVDDDAKAKNNYVERALYVIDSYPFDCFGGVYNAWYTVEKPRWISDDFGSNRKKQAFTGTLEYDYMDGGNMVWKKEILNKLGGFNTAIGMIGNRIGYGEETLIQELARRENYLIGFDPLLQIDHYVQPYKLNVHWHIKSSYVLGRQYWEIFDKQPEKTDSSIWAYQYITRRFLSRAFQLLPKVIFCKKYYWQNFILDSLNEYVLDFGKVKAAREFCRSRNE